MTLKLLQLNIFQGKFLDNIVEFVKKNDIDILCLQEVTGGAWSHGGVNHYPDSVGTVGDSNKSIIGIDCFEKLKSELSYDGDLLKFIAIKNDKSSYQSNAILFKNVKLLNRQDLWMLPYKEYEKVEDARPDTQPRAALNLEFEVENKKFNVICSHMAWGRFPVDQDYKIEQAETLHDALVKLKNPFIFAADFNVTADTKTAKTFEGLAKNLTEVNGIKNTLNPRTHAIKNLFPSGLAVDFILVTPDINVKSFRLVDEVDLSDHFGLLLEFEI